MNNYRHMLAVVLTAYTICFLAVAIWIEAVLHPAGISRVRSDWIAFWLLVERMTWLALIGTILSISTASLVPRNRGVSIITLIGYIAYGILSVTDPSGLRFRNLQVATYIFAIVFVTACSWSWLRPNNQRPSLTDNAHDENQ